MVRTTVHGSVCTRIAEQTTTYTSASDRKAETYASRVSRCRVLLTDELLEERAQFALLKT